MASISQVRTYLAYWFQLGKPVVFQDSRDECLPAPIFQGQAFSHAFEHCWQRVYQMPEHCYLQGTDQTIAHLLTEEWDITNCSRCTMPVPMPVKAIAPTSCPCTDLPMWPNNEIPQPRMGVADHSHLDSIRSRLAAVNTLRDRLQSSYTHSADLPHPKSQKSGSNASSPDEASSQDARSASDS